MTTLQVNTAELCALLADLSHTAPSDPEFGALAGIVLHTSRGHVGTDPGQTTLLVGTSTTRTVAGHAYTSCSGYLHEPMLWPIGDVRAALAVLRPLAKADKAHTTAISRDGASVVLAEVGDPALFDDLDAPAGTELRFTVGDLTDYPRGIWALLGDIHTASVVFDTDGRAIDAAPRTDLTAAALLPFCRVARSRGEAIELYRYHQRRAVLVQIGPAYRGVLMPASYEDGNPSEVTEPPGEVYAPVLPEPVEPEPST
ncbi:hypothetical protein [Saccharopolyspora sp. NPDC002686]|uniref:hypothetical protein n=1 Tax=Saccharopolyspora sp. NPDC002686 TaxID=3154541 RepID=UPI00331F178A